MEIRVLIIGLAGLVREMIEEAVRAQPGVVVVTVSDAVATTDLRQAVGVASPDVIVVGTPDAGLAPQALEALRSRPGLRVVALDPARGVGVLYEMRPHAVLLGDVAPNDIVTAIRTGR